MSVSVEIDFFYEYLIENWLLYTTLHSFQKADVSGIQFTYDDLIKKMGYADLNRNLKGAGGFLNYIYSRLTGLSLAVFKIIQP